MASVIDIIVGMNTRAVATGVQAIKSQIADLKKDFSSTFAELGATAGIVEAIRHTIEYGDKVADLSKKFAINAEFLQQVSNAASVSGGSMEDSAAALNKMIINQQKAIDGNKELVEGFQVLGISQAELIGMSPEDLFMRIADGVKNAADRGQAYGAVVQVLGKSAGNLFETLSMGSEEIKKVGTAMGIMGNDTVEAMDRASDRIKAFTQRFTIITGAVVDYTLRVVDFVAAGMAAVIGLGAAAGQALIGNFSRAAELVGNTNSMLKASLKDLTEGSGGKGNRPGAIDPDREATSINAAKELSDREQREKRIANLREQIAEQQRSTALKNLEVEQRINALLEERAQVNRDISNTADVEKNLALRMKMAKIDEEVRAAEKEKETNAEQARKAEQASRERAVKDQESYADKIEKKGQAIRDVNERAEYDALKTRDERRAFLIEKQKKLEKELAEIPLVEIDKVLDKQKEIAEVKASVGALDRQSPAVPKVAADALARIGGGGNVALGTGTDKLLSESQKQTKLLQKIADSTGANAALS